ncbi:MAG: hypothetical protein IPM57_07315 [Oligoflexia bacterium]|nr:hypothetical protein [Oligoflexia bacterium]
MSLRLDFGKYSHTIKYFELNFYYLQEKTHQDLSLVQFNIGVVLVFSLKSI